ncbi:MAG: FAD-binding oxidoreductase [Planctomycetota bacterium]
MPDLTGFLKDLAAAGVRAETSDQARRGAERDGSQLKLTPVCVVFPADASGIAAVVRACRKHKLPVSVAGGHTGLSGGILGPGAVRIETLQMDRFTITGDAVHAEAGAGIPAIMRAAAPLGFDFPFQPASASRAKDAYDYLGVPVGPVTVGGSLGANASGLVGCKLGAALDWVTRLTVITPAGEVRVISNGFHRFVGTEGRFGIIADADIRLSPKPRDQRTFLVAGDGYKGFAAAADAIGKSGVLPLFAEAMVAGTKPPDFNAITAAALSDPEPFRREFSRHFQPGAWLILLQGDEAETGACTRAVAAAVPGALIRPLTPVEFTSMKLVRSAASDAVVRADGVKTVPGDPLDRAAGFISEAIAEFRKLGIQPKSEHNFGLMRTYLESDAEREAYRRSIAAGEAFDNGTLGLYDTCKGDLREFLRRTLDPVITDTMVKERTAVNFAGNEDILIPAAQFENTVALLNRLLEKYGACPSSLYYCHVNFRRKPGWVLIHNRLLMDVAEFKKKEQ